MRLYACCSHADNVTTQSIMSIWKKKQTIVAPHAPEIQNAYTFQG